MKREDLLKGQELLDAKYNLFEETDFKQLISDYFKIE